VSKERLDVYLHPAAERLRVANDAAGLRALKRKLGDASVARVLMEATGKLHRAAWRSLAASGFHVTIADPRRIRDLAKGLGFLAKTDALDACVLATICAALPAAASPVPAKALEELQELVNARLAAVADATALSNRAKASQLALLRDELAKAHRACMSLIGRLDDEVARRVQADPGIARRFAILSSIPGIGAVTAATLVATMSELGSIDGKQAAMLAGVAPLADDSGKRKGHRSIRGGRATPRRALYLAALSASRHNPTLAPFAMRLKGAGKKPKVVIVAVMRKLIVMANVLIAQDRQWSPFAP
jgi:transposase